MKKFRLEVQENIIITFFFPKHGAYSNYRGFLLSLCFMFEFRQLLNFKTFGESKWRWFISLNSSLSYKAMIFSKYIITYPFTFDPLVRVVKMRSICTGANAVHHQQVCLTHLHSKMHNFTKNLSNTLQGVKQNLWFDISVGTVVIEYS